VGGTESPFAQARWLATWFLNYRTIMLVAS